MPASSPFAAPVCSPEALAGLTEPDGPADEAVYLLAPDDFQAVGEWYVDFTQLEDADVLRLLAEGQ